MLTAKDAKIAKGGQGYPQITQIAQILGGRGHDRENGD
jgi:hypothetical protein